MHASRVILSRETRLKLAQPGMSETDKQKLRMTKVIEYIDKQPVGKAIPHSNVLAATGFDVRDANEYAKAKYIIKTLIRQGVIEHDGVKHSRSANYKIKKTAPEATKITRSVEYSITKLEEEAKEYAWRTGSDSLREFIKYKLNNNLNNNNQEKSNG